ncbi:MAG: lipopolysaccharide kinase InaA family protein [Planctomycetota bacterium]
MQAPPLPAGFTKHQSGNRTIYHAVDLTEAIRELGFFDGAATLPAVSTVQGRTGHGVYDLPRAGGRVLWKKCGRGGWIEPILRDRYLNAARFLDELAVTEAARTQGASVPRILAIADTRTAGGFHRIEVLTEMLEGARDGAELLTPGGHPLPPDDSPMGATLRRSVLSAMARELRLFHGLGFVHGDLNVKNVLWRVTEDDSVAVTLIDLDPGSSPLRAHSPLSNLLRLHRSYWKGVLKRTWRLSATDQYRFLYEYFRGDRAGLRDFWQSARRQAQRQALRRGQRLTPLEPRRLSPL